MSELKRYGHEKLRQAIAAVFRAGKADEATARTVADMLVDANLSGHDSHGIQMVSYYVDCLNNGTLDPAGRAAHSSSAATPRAAPRAAPIGANHWL